MRGKHDCIVVNLRTGEPVLRVPALETILEAADWNTDIALKKYAGETLELAKQAAGGGCEMVIGYGGDGKHPDVKETKASECQSQKQDDEDEYNYYSP
jgi:diacylglycerol kinase family enzyme